MSLLMRVLYKYQHFQEGRGTVLTPSWSSQLCQQVTNLVSPLTNVSHVVRPTSSSKGESDVLKGQLSQVISHVKGRYLQLTCSLLRTATQPLMTGY